MDVAEQTAMLRRCLEGLDLTSADGRAGLRCVLREIEALSPGIIAQVNAGQELRMMGLSTVRP